MENENKLPSLNDRLEMLRRRWVYPVLIVPACILLAAFIAFVLPPQFRSSGTILLEPSSVPDKLVQTVTSYADQQFELIQRRVMTEDSLIELVKKVDPYPDLPDVSVSKKANMVRDATEVERVDPVTLETLAESSAFSIHYQNPDPKLALAVSNELVTLFLDYNKKTRQERAQTTYQFLLAESRKLQNSIRDMESRRAEFKTKYGDALPEAQTRNLQALDSARQDYDAQQARIRLAEERESLLALQLANVSPTLEGVASDTRTQLATLKAELSLAEKRYTPEHPDVKRLRAAIRTLVEQGAGNGAKAARPDNPEYLQVQSQLTAARRELAALRAAAGRAYSQAEGYSRKIELAPSVEREYAQLSRDYQIAQEQFRDIQGRLKEAGLTQALVEEQQGERFTLVREPRLASKPYSPNRLGIILIGLVFGTALGLGAAMFVELSDPTVRSARDLAELTGQNMIAAVPELLNRSELRQRRLRWGSVAVAFGIAVAAVSVVMLARGL
jgi:succinoglycan biosynthesis transport protein ExoP